MLSVGGLFSGIGGLELGLHRAGMTIVWMCERDAFCRSLLRRHWREVPILEDVRDVRGGTIEPVDLICGGFPCQDISIAGRGEGLAGERSGLWREMSRIAGELRPRFLLVENVPALLDRGFGEVLGDLAALGFDAEWDCIPASAFGAPHERDRLFLVANSGSEFSGSGRIFDGQYDISGNIEWSSTKNIKSGRGWKRWLVETCEALDRQGCNPWFRRVDDGLPEWLDAIKALGNAVVPTVAEAIGRQIIKHLKQQPSRAADLAPELRTPKLAAFRRAGSTVAHAHKSCEGCPYPDTYSHFQRCVFRRITRGEVCEAYIGGKSKWTREPHRVRLAVRQGMRRVLAAINASDAMAPACAHGGGA
jgi:DNA (cytosine-5)-methyltransferase 1